MELWKRCIVRDQQVVLHCEFNPATPLQCTEHDACPSPHFSTASLEEPLSVNVHVLTDPNPVPQCNSQDSVPPPRRIFLHQPVPIWSTARRSQAVCCTGKWALCFSAMCWLWLGEHQVVVDGGGVVISSFPGVLFEGSLGSSLLQCHQLPLDCCNVSLVWDREKWRIFHILLWGWLIVWYRTLVKVYSAGRSAVVRKWTVLIWIKCFLCALQTVGNTYGNFSLATMFPRREFTKEDYGKKLLELELAPSASVVLLPVGVRVWCVWFFKQQCSSWVFAVSQPL